MSKPRLTDVVLDGLSEAVRLAESITQDLVHEGRDLDSVRKVQRAAEWVTAMRAYHRAKKKRRP